MRLPSLLREPLLWFLAIGALLFLWYRWSEGGSGTGTHRIVLTPGRIESLAAAFRRTWQRPPTDAEIKDQIDEFVREEIATREAMAAGLDRDDTVIRRRLRQKLEFLVEDAAGFTAPTDEEIQAWIDAHPDTYRTEPRVSFCQVYVSTERRGAAAAADARALLQRLAAADPAAAPGDMGDPTILPPAMDLETKDAVERTFGAEFADRVFALAPGRWAGPIGSTYGMHLVRVGERIEETGPAGAEVRRAAERDLLAERRRAQVDAMYRRLLETYTVVVEEPRAMPAEAGR